METKSQRVSSLKVGMRVDAAYVLKRKLLKKNPDGSRFILFQFSDSTGVIGGILWDDAEVTYKRLAQGGFVRLVGEVQTYRDTQQVRVFQVEPLESERLDLADFLPVTPYDRDELFAEWMGHVDAISDPALAALLRDMAENEDLSWRFRSAPAGKTWHHPYVGGLLEHVVKLCRIAKSVCDLYPELNRDLMMAACYLHDLGKVRELDYAAAIEYNSEGRLVGHVVQGVEILDEFLPRHPDLSRETAIRLKHLIVSHQGAYEYGSPKLPMSLEAIAFHHIDNLDAQIDGFARVIREGRESQGEDSHWTGIHRLLGRPLFIGEDRHGD